MGGKARGRQLHFTCHFELQKGDDDTVYLAASLVLHQDQLSREVGPQAQQTPFSLLAPGSRLDILQ